VEQDVPPVRPTGHQLLRELDLQLEAAADALSQAVPAHDLARSSVGRAREALAQLRAEHDAEADAAEPDAAALALVRRMELAPDRSSARRARAFAGQTCDRWALPTSVRNAAVDIASELVANAAAHGSGPVVLALERGAGNLLVRAWDDGPGTPRVLPYRPGLSDKGLGLRLVKQLSSHWGAAADDGGKWVWARIALPEPERD
jgi:anti-sigma regulatory factor (Ser/Thr protein kinase)